MPKKKAKFLKKKDVIVYGGKEHTITSLAWDKPNNRVTILGTGGFAESVSLDSNISIK